MDSRDLDAIEAVLNGNTDRFADLVDAYQEQAVRIAYTFLSNHEEARDVAQEAFIRAYRSLGSFRRRAKFSTWFYRIVVNLCKDAHRQRLRRPVAVATIASADYNEESPSIFIEVSDTAAGPGDQLANKELARRLTEAIAALPGKQHEAFVLHHLHGLPVDEVSEIMHCRPGTVKSHLFRASESLRMKLSPWIQQEGQRR